MGFAIFDSVKRLSRLSNKLGVNLYLKRLLEPLFEERAMQFPSFSSDIHRSLVTHRDYVRLATFGLAIERIRSEGVDGSFAELGVYQGETSRFVHKMAPNRDYYLFDTFEGFPEEDLEANTVEDDRFRNTSVDAVLRNIGDQNNILVRKGYVPDTLEGLEHERFAFVLLDLDLYSPTMRSLDFFYPRVAKGGYLFIHDYNNPESNWGPKRAVDDFMENKPEEIVEIPDRFGTALFRKQ